MFLFSIPSKGIEISKPQWTEFYSEQYYNMKYLPTDKTYIKSLANMPYCKSEKKWVKVVNNVTILPALDCSIAGWMRKNSINTYNNTVTFWQDRQFAFDSAVATCDSSPKDQRTSCYMMVRQLEIQKKATGVGKTYYTPQIADFIIK